MLFRDQPKALPILFFVEMWERFSYYGMRCLLVLYMTEEVHWRDSKALAIYALYTALIEMGAVFGGRVADRLLGLKPSIVLGGALIAAGHGVLFLLRGEGALFYALSLIIVGSSLFVSNIKALLGQCYEEGDGRREAGFTLFYAGINLGGFFAAVLCGVVQVKFGWHAGFGLAALGMVLGLGVLCLGRGALRGVGERRRGGTVGLQVVGALCVAGLPVGVSMLFYYPALLYPMLPLVGLGVVGYLRRELKGRSAGDRRGVRFIVVLTGALVVFFTFEELMGSVIVLFCERFVDRHGIPSAALLAVNPLVVIVGGFLLARVKRGAGTVFRGFMLLGGAFVVLFLGGIGASFFGKVPLMSVVVSFVMIAVGELFVAPPLFAYCSREAPEGLQGTMMAVVVMGFGVASLVSGWMGAGVAAMTRIGGPLPVYTGFFGVVGMVILGVSWIAKRRLFEKFFKIAESSRA